MEKISAAQVDHVMLKAASALRAQGDRITELEAQVAKHERRDHAEKIASSAVDRGIVDPEEGDAYASDLADSDQDLNMVEEFVGRAAAGVPLGKTLEKVASESGSGDGESDVLTSFLLSSDIAG